MQAIEKSDEVEVAAGIILGFSGIEFHAVGDACFRGALPRGGDGSVVIVVTDKRGFWIRLGHQYGGRAMPASHIGNPRALLQPRFDAFQRGNPGAYQVRGVVGPEKSFRAAKKLRVMFMPADSRARAERFADPLFGLRGSQRHLECSRKIDRAFFVGQSKNLFFVHAVLLRFWIVFNVAARGLRAEPFADVTLVAAGTFGQLFGTACALRQRLV